MQFLDARRLTGPSLLFDEPGSILDVACEPDRVALLAACWQSQVARMLERLGWPAPKYAVVPLTGGVSLGFTAPIDTLYAASEVNEWAYAASDAELEGADEPDFEDAVDAIRKSAAEEANHRLIELARAAGNHGVTLLWDDDYASLGLGRHARTWPVRELPEPARVDWSSHRDVPVGLVTGTNGKTTTVRLAAHILRKGGTHVGVSSTDWIAVDDRVIDRDDWSGPGGARAVLREAGVDAAVLETARGGLLRRGLGVGHAVAALITNIARDHLGDFGSHNLDELLAIKWIVSRAVVDAGTLVLNADDPMLVAAARDYPGRLVWFSLEPGNDVIRRHRTAGGTVWLLEDGDIVTANGGTARICEAAEVPIAMGGSARHNIANALAAAALTEAMGTTHRSIHDGLLSMSQDLNPGRGNVYQVRGFTVLVDFAHNPQAIRALLGMASRMDGKRRALCFGQAGDRPDDLIRELARDAWETGLDHVFVSELAHYHRGRSHGDVHAIIRDELLACGATPGQIEHHEEEIDSLEAALAWARPGDLVVMLALQRSPALYERLEDLASS